MYKFILIISFISTFWSIDDNQQIYNQLIRKANAAQWQNLDNGNLLLKTGSFFIGKPYKSGALDKHKIESLYIDFNTFDCFTFVEQTLAISDCIKSKESDFQYFIQKLQTLRYRKGIIDGYPSRLHYFSEWLAQAESNNFLTIIKPKQGSETTFSKPINFMSSHTSSYPNLSIDDNLNIIKKQELALGQKQFVFTDKKHLKSIIPKIHNGDIIAFVSNRKGLDFEHCGFAVIKNKQIYLLHASSKAKKVVVSKENLTKYLQSHAQFAGIVVARKR